MHKNALISNEFGMGKLTIITPLIVKELPYRLLKCNGT